MQPDAGAFIPDRHPTRMCVRVQGREIRLSASGPNLRLPSARRSTQLLVLLDELDRDVDGRAAAARTGELGVFDDLLDAGNDVR